MGLRCDEEAVRDLVFGFVEDFAVCAGTSVLSCGAADHEESR